MSKADKDEGLPKPSTLKRLDPPAQQHKKAGHKRKDYPRHWEVRTGYVGKHFLVWDSKRKIGLYWHLDTQNTALREALGVCVHNGDLDGYLDLMAQEHPESGAWPVRFINIQPLATRREVIPN